MITRRKCLSQLAALGMAPFISDVARGQTPLLTRAIPGSGEKIPIVGIGTWQTFDVGESDSQRSPLKEVLSQFSSLGGRVIDSSPMYGRSEEVVGDLSSELQLNEKLFIATKVWTTGKEDGIRQMNESFSLLQRDQIDLLQIHNLVDWRTHLKTLQKWKDEQKIRYIGLTHYTDNAHATIAGILKEQPVDFIQINYNLLDTHAERELLPLAQERNVAVLVNRPFEEGALFQKVKGKSLPPWAVEFDCSSWAQFFLKFILSHPAVTCAIPGTSKVSHLIDNLKAATGRLPDLTTRQKMIKAVS